MAARPVSRADRHAAAARRRRALISHGRRRLPGRALRATLALACSAALACSLLGREAEDAQNTPERVAQRVFELAQLDEPTRAAVETVFGPLSERENAALRDALSGLAPLAEPRLVAVTPPSFDEQRSVEFEARLGAGGQTRVSVLVAPDAEGRWYVRSFFGSGVEWPLARRPHGPGLSSSSEPPPRWIAPGAE